MKHKKIGETPEISCVSMSFCEKTAMHGGDPVYVLSEEKAVQNRTNRLAVCLGAREASWVSLSWILYLYKKLQFELCQGIL